MQNPERPELKPSEVSHTSGEYTSKAHDIAVAAFSGLEESTDTEGFKNRKIVQRRRTNRIIRNLTTRRSPRSLARS